MVDVQGPDRLSDETGYLAADLALDLSLQLPHNKRLPIPFTLLIRKLGTTKLVVPLARRGKLLAYVDRQSDSEVKRKHFGFTFVRHVLAM
jgi:hypothetical protein